MPRLPAGAGDACVDRRRARGVKRLLSVLLCCVTLALASCKDPDSDSKDPALAFVQAGTDVVVHEVRIYTPQDAVAGTHDEYYIVKFTFTNGEASPLAPRLDHFVLQDESNTRYFGAESGSPTLIGISNYPGVLKVGDAHDYTLGFRVPTNTKGTLFYDDSF